MNARPINGNLLARDFFEEIRRIIDFWTCKVVDNTTSGFHGHIEKDGTINNKAHKGAILCSRILWFLAEALIAFLLAEELDPDKNNLTYFISLWNHIKAKHIDKRHGEWLSYSKDDMAKGLSSPLVNEWKGPYHNGQAMLKAFQYFNQKTEEI